MVPPLRLSYGLLHRCRHIGQRYLLLVFFSFLACVNYAGERSDTDDSGRNYNLGFHKGLTSYRSSMNLA